MASVIVVDNELKDSLKEYRQIIDSAAQNTSFSEVLNPLLEDAQLAQKQEIIAALYAHSQPATLTKLTDKEFEPAVYLLVHILSQLGVDLADEKSGLYEIIVESNPHTQPTIRDRKSIKSTTILSILNTLFNLLPETSQTRAHIIAHILTIVEKSKLDFGLVQNSIGLHLVQWLKSSGTSEEQIRSTFWRFIALDSTFSAQTLQLIKSFTQSFAVSAGELTQLIKFALSSEVVDVSFLINNNVAASLAANSSDALVAAFSKYVNGDLVELSSADFADLPVAEINAKSRILSLSKFFSQQSSSADHSDIVFKYSEIPNVTSSQDFENLLVGAIKSGVVVGKLNQVEEVFYLSRVNRFVLAGNDAENTAAWNSVRSTLQEWRASLTNINEIVKSSRENIVNNNSN
ncbi:predicted protein [Scheffersomyces stipitis CBS 6054]|uniref:PCI domain-containing protein n=1 Tax=Scheffersomyces stipitis (strain ATCC 58785 / CBS 6054 / NBRC 10063 / NRRL Y-11545) TaxID=322104 RepID=A3LUA9_PICST|nr:predicted protein [Scheffersomyces stipitis CBS 6054]ABN66555.1 predicted protein [Scheffersomyces stipitis CBS 6054]